TTFQPFTLHDALPILTYACKKTIIPTRAASAILWKNTNRRISPSCPYQLVAVLATTILCASTIFPITPPALLAEAIKIGLTPVRSEEHTSELQSREKL